LWGSERKRSVTVENVEEAHGEKQEGEESESWRSKLAHGKLIESLVEKIFNQAKGTLGGFSCPSL